MVTGGGVERLEVRVLGRCRLASGGTDLSGFRSPRLQALLVALLVRRDAPVPRSELAFRLWPDSTERQARTNLRQLIHDLRRALPNCDDVVEITSSTLRWRDDAPAVVDLVVFQTAVASAARAGDVAEERAALDLAASAYGGELLPAHYEDWVLAERDQLRRSVERVLERIAELAEQTGDIRGAIAATEQLLRHDPLQEAAYRRLMRLHAVTGDVARAVHAYHTCVSVLEDELGIEPGEETRRAYRRLIRNQGDEGPQLGRAVGAGPALVGRAAEWDRMLGAWRGAQEHGARALLVSGEPGIGKSRLLEELARLCSRSGSTVVRSRCYDGEARLAYAPVADWLRSDSLRHLLTQLDPGLRRQLARLLPELDPDAASPGPSVGSDPEGRQRLFHAVARALVVANRPTLLLLDDAQWSDAETLAFLHYLLRAEPAAPLLLACTARTEEVGEDHSLSTFLAKLARDGLLDEIALGPLSAQATVELATQLVGRELDRALAERVVRETEGNPLFVVEAVRAGLGRDADTASSYLTATVQAVIQVRLGQLSAATRDVVDVAATVGRQFSVEVVNAVVGSEEAVIGALDELWRRRIVREQGAATYDFTHDKLRESTYARISPVRRRRLHRQVAEALEAVHGRGAGAVSGRLAEHYEQAGLVRPAIAAYRCAAEHAQELFAYDDAIAALRRALLLLERLPADRERDALELDLRTALGVPLVSLLGYGAAPLTEECVRARQVAARLGVPAAPPVLRALGLAAVADCRLDEAARLARELLEVANGPDTVEAVEGHYVLGVTRFWQGDFRGAEAELERAIASYRHDNVARHTSLYAQDPYVVCTARLAWAQWFLGRQERAARLARDAVERAEELGHRPSSGYVRCYHGMLAVDLGDDEAVEASVRHGEHIWSGFFEPMVPALRGWLACRHDPSAGLHLVEQGAAGYRTPGRTLHLTWVLRLLGTLRLETGDLQGAMLAVEEALAHGEVTGQRYLEADLRQLEAEILAARGDRDDAERALAEACRVAHCQDRSALPVLRTRAASRNA